MRAKKHSTPITLGTASAAVLLGLVAGTANAGKIVGATGDDGDITGWDTSNILVKVYDADGGDVSASYNAANYPDPVAVDYATFESEVLSGATLVGVLLGKDYPIGQPPGMKVVTSDNNLPFSNGKPSNCIMTTSYLEGGYLDSATPLQNSCDGPFQSHKRFKIDMLPASVGVGALPIDLTFEVEADAEIRDYQVFQKINNYTGGRLAGFEIQLIDNTTGSASGVSLTLSGLWDAAQYEAANFSNGLWGPIEPGRFDTTGFFSDTRSGFNLTVDSTPGASSITSSGVISDNYSDVDDTNLQGTDLDGIFGEWLPYIWAPYGIFFDDDNDPETDAQLMAFWDGADWRLGDADSFAAATPTQVSNWLGSAAYSIGKIEDVVNLGLNYIVRIPDDVTGGTFTLRFIPTESAAAADAPGYVSTPPDYSSSADGVVLIGPNPVDAGATLYMRANDSDLVAGPVTVTVTNTATGETEAVDLDLVIDGVVQGTFPTSTDASDNGNDSGLLYVAAGDVIQVDYVDPNDGADTATATTTVATPVVPSNGGGGCTIGSASGKGDWTLPALLAAMLGFGLMRRRRSQALKA